MLCSKFDELVVRDVLLARGALHATFQLTSDAFEVEQVVLLTAQRTHFVVVIKGFTADQAVLILVPAGSVPLDQ